MAAEPQSTGYDAGVRAVVTAIEDAIERFGAEFYTPSLRIEAVHVEVLRAALAPFKDEAAS